MALTLTLTRAPGVISEARWRTLRRGAEGHGDHDVRVRVDGAVRPSGDQLALALGSWADIDVEVLVATVAGLPLRSLPPGSPLIHPGMVITLHSSSDGATSTASAPPSADRTRLRSPGLQLCLEAGPDSGRLMPLPRGRHRVGRGRTGVQVADPQMGREHLDIDVGTRSVTVRQPVASGRKSAARFIRGAVWTAEDPLEAGATVLRLVTAPARPTAAGSWPPVAESVEEKPPEGRHRMMLLMAMVPLVVGIVMVTVTGMWFFLLFSAVSALVAVFTIADAARRRRRFRAAVSAASARWGSQVDALLDTPGDVIRRLRGSSAPPGTTGSPGASSAILSSPAEQIGGMAAAVVRLGRGSTVPDLDVGAGASLPWETSVHCAVALPLHSGELTRIIGSARATRRLLRWVLDQLLLRAPEVRAPVLLVTDHADWVSVLQDHADLHITGGQTAAEVLSTALRASGDDGNPAQPVPVVVVDGPADAPLLAQALHRGWSVVALHEPGQPDRSEPSTLRAGWTIDVDEGTLTRDDATPTVPGTPRAWELTCDGLSAAVLAEHLRLALPRCGTGNRGGVVPAEHETALPQELMDRSAADSLLSVLGRSATGDEVLDLVEDGPHILIAGTSGSGKSELLKSLILGWVARYGPEELNLVLVDFKGGATFHQLAALEHSLGLITDLSRAQAERTLEGIRSELVRRERLFLETGVGDYAEFRRVRPDEPLARILVVIDEFRIFSHELPETMDELMRLATLGRSLGLHLVLSTQRPQGVVTADIRANIGSILTLRLRSEDESRDLVGTVEAGRIPRNLPGRGVLRRPGEKPVIFQTGLLTSSAHEVSLDPAGTDPPTPPGADSAVPGRVGSRTIRTTRPGSEATQQVTAVLRQRCLAGGLRRHHTPLLPALPETLEPGSCHEDRENTEETASQTHDQVAVLGRLDLPADQVQRPVMFDPATLGSIGMIGEAESGGRDALSSLASQLLSLAQPVTPAQRLPEVHLLDGDRSLHRFSDHLRVASWLGDEHLEEVQHLLELLHDEMIARRSVASTAGTPVVVLVSGYGQWHQLAQTPAGGSMEHLLGRLISEGADVGISVVVCGGRELTSSRLGARLARRIYLPHAVSQDTRLLWPKLRSVDGIPGRGVLLSPEHPSPGAEIQLVTHPISDHLLDHAARHDRASPAIAVRPLPERVSETDLSQVSGRIGLEQFTQAPVTWRQNPVSLILGTSGSGRSTCLRRLAKALPDAAVMEPNSTWPEDSPAPTVLIDDAEGCTAEQHRLVDRWILNGSEIVATARPSPSLYSQIPWAHHARASPMNMVLSPTHRSQGDFFAVTVPVLARPVPGRAVHLRPEGPRFIQWAFD